MNSKVLLFTDLHGWDDMSLFKVGTVGSRYKQTIDAILRYARDHNITQVINLWDTWIANATEQQNRNVSNYVQEVLWWSGLETILGNHCMGSLDRMKERDLKMYGSIQTPRLIKLWESKKGVLFDDIDYDSEGFSKATDRSLEKLDSIVRWLDEETSLFSHYPITNDPNNTFFGYASPNQWTFLSNSPEVREIIKWTRITRVFNGHVHRKFQVEIDGIIHTTIPSVSNDYEWHQKWEVWVLDTSTWELEIVDLFQQAA